MSTHQNPGGFIEYWWPCPPRYCGLCSRPGWWMPRHSCARAASLTASLQASSRAVTRCFIKAMLSDIYLWRWRLEKWIFSEGGRTHYLQQILMFRKRSECLALHVASCSNHSRGVFHFACFRHSDLGSICSFTVMKDNVKNMVLQLVQHLLSLPLFLTSCWHNLALSSKDLFLPFVSLCHLPNQTNSKKDK